VKIRGVKIEWHGPLLAKFKKHYCPQCKAEFERVKTSRVVDSRSEEAKDYDFSCGDGYMSGCVRFIQTEYKCHSCNKIYSLKEIKEARQK